MKFMLIGGIILIIVTIVFTTLKYINQFKNNKISRELKERSWEGIGKYENNISVGWVLMFIGIIFWIVWYMLIGYPTNQFAEIGQYNEKISDKSVARVLKKNKKSIIGEMPHFDRKLSDTQVKAIENYLRSISEK
jgi:hypothetical protein